MAIVLTTDDTRREVFLKAEQANIKTGGSGTADHRQLTNRDADNQHPISAITGLQAELGWKQNKLTAGDRISIDANNVISADEQVFIVTADFNNTTMTNVSHTFAEISTAYDAGKVVFLRTGLFEFEATAKDKNSVTFTAPLGKVTYIAAVRNTDVWAANEVRKVNEITDSATNTQYPSALAVFNYVNSVIGNVSAALSAMDAVIGGDAP